jgi:hypothetical protein
VLTRSLQFIFGRASMTPSSDGSDPSLAGRLAAVAEVRAVAEEISRHIETVVTREDVLRPAREALAAAEKKKQLGNDGFRKGDFLAAYAEYMEAHKALDVASAEPTTAYAAEVLRLTVLANTAQCALKTGQPSAAANFCRDAIKLSNCVNDEKLFKKILVRLAQAHEQMGEREKALAVAHEAQLRGVNCEEFFALTKKYKAENVGDLEPGVEMRMFIMLAIRLSAGPENLERLRSVLQTGKLPHVDRRDEAGFNVLWGVLQALSVEEDNRDGVEGGEASVPALALLFQAGADPRQRYEKGGKTPLMYACGSGLVTAVQAVLSAPGGVGAFDRAAIDAPDDGGWTALLVACTAPQPKKEEEARRTSVRAPSGPDAAAVVRLLLDRGADPRVQNAQGNDALMIAAINGNADVVAELLTPPSCCGSSTERKHTGPALTRARNAVGMSAYVLASKAGNAGVATDLLAAARACGGATAEEAEEDAKMIKLIALLDVVAAAHNDALESTLRSQSALCAEPNFDVLKTPFAVAETEAARVVALLSDSGFDLPKDVDKHDAPRVAFETYGDVYSALYRKIADATPKALTKTFSWNGDEKESGPTRAEAASVYWFQRGEFAEGHGGVETGLETGLPKAPLNSGALDEKEKPGTLVAATEHGARVPSARLDTATEALKHAFAFAVPCAAALDAVAALGVGVVEVGCGTAYWACLLRERGVDVVAYDARPPTRLSASLGPEDAGDDKDDDKNLFFGATFAEDGVLRGGPEVLRNHADRALFLCWPVSPEEVAHRGEARDKPWDAACLDHWHGDTLIHVGEWARHRGDSPETSPSGVSGDVAGESRDGARGETFPRGTSLVNHPAGLTTSRQFQDAVEAGFELQKVVRLPNWPGARDDLTVWVRKR